MADAKKDINPANPKAGPGGVDASSSPESPAFTLGGKLANGGGATGQASPSSPTAPASAPTSALLDISV